LLEARWESAARRFEEAVRCNPALSDAHAFLGTMRCSTGDVAEGTRMLDVAVRLDPRNVAPIWEKALVLGLSDHPRRAFEVLDRADFVVQNHPSTIFARMRVAAWHSDAKELMRARDDAAHVPSDRHSLEPALIRLYVDDDTDRQIGVLTALASSPHAPELIRGHILQAVCERMALAGDATQALGALRAVARWSIDARWFERCPSLARLRRAPAFQPLRAQVSEAASRVFPASSVGF